MYMFHLKGYQPLSRPAFSFPHPLHVALKQFHHQNRREKYTRQNVEEIARSPKVNPVYRLFCR
jgi:hypothetical protein